MFDLAIQGVIHARGLRQGCVYVRDGTIVKVSPEITDRAERVIHLGKDQLLLPAATDLHVHLRDWRQSYKETITSGTRAALAGGVTTVAEMPNTEPRLNTEETIRRRFHLLREKSYVDFAIHAGVPEKTDEVDDLRKAGAFAVKIYPDDMGRFVEVARRTSRLGMKIAVHAEERAMIGTSKEPLAEVACVEKLLEQLDRRMDVRFAHISTERAAALVARKRLEGYKLTLEVAPHHMFVTKGVSESRIGTASAVRPPLRKTRTVAKMASLFNHSAFDFFATDHAPHSTREKLSRKPAPGFTGVEFAYALLITRSGIETACRTYCENPARYLGIRKGVIEKGYEADMAIFSRRRWALNPSKFVSKGTVTPFEGEVLDFAIEAVIKGGELAYSKGKFERPPAKTISRAAGGR